MSELRSHWAELEAGHLSQAHLAVRQVGSAPAGPVFVAVDGAGARHLLVPAATGDAVPVDRRSRGVVLIGQELEFDGAATRFADLVCVDGDLAEVFVRLSEDVAERVGRAAANGPGVVQDVLAEWRQLLSRASKLGSAASVGLIGELEVLRAGLLAAGPSALDTWKGPLGAAHDFVTDKWAIEVKTSTAREGRLCEIHGLEQLEPLASGRLLLAWVALREDPGGLTLYERVERVLDSGAPRQRLLELLGELGYAHDPRALPEERWVTREQLWFEVDAAFPKITAASFAGGPPPGVQRLRYIVDLAAGPEPLAEESATALLSEMA